MLARLLFKQGMSRGVSLSPAKTRTIERLPRAGKPVAGSENSNSARIAGV